QGRTLSTPTSVTLTEAQRMTATSIAMWRVVPGDEGDRSALEWRLVPGDSLALRSGDQVLLPAGAGVRFESGRRVAGAPTPWAGVPGDEGDRSALEWRLVPGDSLALRSGDQVLLPAGAGVRFESGRRVPGAPISGVAWADATASSALDGLLAAAGACDTRDRR